MNITQLSKKNEILPFVAIWMDLEGITLSEVRKRQIRYDFIYVWNLNIQNKQRNRFIKTENKLRLPVGRIVAGLLKWFKGIGRYRLLVME